MSRRCAIMWFVFFVSMGLGAPQEAATSSPLGTAEHASQETRRIRPNVTCERLSSAAAAQRRDWLNRLVAPSAGGDDASFKRVPGGAIALPDPNTVSVLAVRVNADGKLTVVCTSPQEARRLAKSAMATKGARR